MGKYFVTIFLALVNYCIISEAASLDEELTLTYKQKLILDKFRDRILARLPQDFMKEDLYLVRFLRQVNFDIKAAERLILETAKWRQDNDIDSIMFEDWSDFEEQYPYYFEGCDIDNRPVASVDVGDWDISKAVISGKRDRMIRYAYRMWEQIRSLIQEGQRVGKNVTQFDMLLNMKGFNLRQTACPACIPLYLTLTVTCEKYFPGLMHNAIVVNAPQLFTETINLLKPLMSQTMRRSIHVFGSNKRHWQNWLHKEIPIEQLTTRFGGMKENAETPDELMRKNVYPSHTIPTIYVKDGQFIEEVQDRN